MNTTYTPEALKLLLIAKSDRVKELAPAPTREQIVNLIDDAAIISNEFGINAYIENTESIADAILALIAKGDTP